MNKRMKLLIAYDGSECSNEALNDLPRAGLPLETEALVVSVCDAALPPSDTLPVSNFRRVPQAKVIALEMEAKVEQARVRALRAVEEAHALAEQAVRKLKSNFMAWNVRAEAMAGTPALAVIKEGDDWNADLIVVGTHGRTALGRMILGSVSQQVAAEAHCSVRVARSRMRKGDLPIRLVIGIDGSPAAEAVVQEAARRNWPAGSEARIIAADTYRPSLAHEELVDVRRMIEIAEEDLSAVAGLHVSSRVIEGDAKSMLIGEAKKLDADCIFVGSGGPDNHGERFMLGSVSEAVLIGAHCSVEVVRARRMP